MPPRAARVRSNSPTHSSRNADPEGTTAASIAAAHPNKWSSDEVMSWLQRQRFEAKLPPGSDGRIVTRWNVKRWTEACGGDERAGLRAFNGIRLEMDRLADEEKRRRKQIMSGRN